MKNTIFFRYLTFVAVAKIELIYIWFEDIYLVSIHPKLVKTFSFKQKHTYTRTNASAPT